MKTEELAWQIRRQGIEITHQSHSSHIASILSVAEIIAVLYNDVMRIFPDEPRHAERDRFILSKGHAGAAVYTALAYKGFFPTEELVSQGANGSRLSEHVSHKGVPGIELSTGSLGHGLGVGAGMALAIKRQQGQQRVFVVMGDGECEEGSVWEAAHFANHYQLHNLVVTIDHNKMQAMTLGNAMPSFMPLTAKWEAFGWHTQVVDGHNITELQKAYRQLSTEKPNCIIANTVKGKGVSFMEQEILWHYRDPQGDDYQNAVDELERSHP